MLDLSFEINHIALNHLVQIIESLSPKKAVGNDSIRSKILKEIYWSHCIITLYINISIVKGKFPYILKKARIIPVHKGGDIHNRIT